MKLIDVEIEKGNGMPEVAPFATEGGGLDGGGDRD